MIWVSQREIYRHLFNGIGHLPLSLSGGSRSTARPIGQHNFRLRAAPKSGEHLQETTRYREDVAEGRLPSRNLDRSGCLLDKDQVQSSKTLRGRKGAR
jgi:hypothetical protein